jgi:hypothetical protein
MDQSDRERERERCTEVNGGVGGDERLLEDAAKVLVDLQRVHDVCTKVVSDRGRSRRTKSVDGRGQ